MLCDHSITFVYKAEFVMKVCKILIACELVPDIDIQSSISEYSLQLLYRR